MKVLEKLEATDSDNKSSYSVLGYERTSTAILPYSLYAKIEVDAVESTKRREPVILGDRKKLVVVAEKFSCRKSMGCSKL